MKRLFIILSNILVSLFLVWVFTIWSDTFVSHYYPSVVVLDASPKASYNQVEAGLTRLAKETDSLIAMQHQEPGPEGAPIVTYTLFGKGKLPNGLTEKVIEEPSRLSVENNYFILKGGLTVERLRDTLAGLGMTKMTVLKPSFLGTVVLIFSSGSQALGLVIFCLTFGALTLIGHIRTLRTAGIRLISGERRWQIFLYPIRSDVCYCCLGLIFGFSLAAVMGQFMSFSPLVLYLIGIGLVCYNLLLVFIALFFAGLFVIGIKRVHLMQVIKGQIPVRGIISLILIAQLLAVLVVSFGASRTLLYVQAERQQKQGQAAWRQEDRLVTLLIGRNGLDIGNTKKAIAKQKTWFHVMDQAVSEHRAILSRHYLVERDLQSGLSMLTASSSWNDYSPQGNVLLVTSQYVKRQKVEVAPDISEKINQLSLGEFVLLLPEHLKIQAAQYQSVFEVAVTGLASGEGHQPMTATVSYTKTGQERFLYNTTPISYQQFLRDPIIVVLTPKSTGEQAYAFWEVALQNYFLFDQLADTQTLIKQNGIENWVGELKTGYRIYETLLNNLRREIWLMIAGAILGIATSVLMFNTMNLLYFEEFRRDIFIKRVSGLRFFELHRRYLLSQLLVFFVGLVISALLTQNPLMCLLVFSLFSGNAILLLYRQMRIENKMSLLILKGA
ncbi:TPA: bacteriocin-associated integral membrane family protein [Streptococcus equi subsp. zooepidemicus]|uniref:DUF1430 domain-containing protein n=1 Tax=Streptococcus equi TaxID=1336 RepID=UPI00294B21BB|nr:DUF1430 domain-containing protein [Streptococcus equi]WOK57327.1 DUF1430 domain-containing protein [Streptococcus equi subsp. zooepidemicus]HEL1075198.1 bacteriocin-associated integral membrane family protein [Streptococcus equi subsp. zooepidemicus]